MLVEFILLVVFIVSLAVAGIGYTVYVHEQVEQEWCPHCKSLEWRRHGIFGGRVCLNCGKRVK